MSFLVYLAGGAPLTTSLVQVPKDFNLPLLP